MGNSSPNFLKSGQRYRKNFPDMEKGGKNSESGFKL